MSGEGSVSGGLPVSSYQSEPQQQPDKQSVGRQFGRQITHHEPEVQYFRKAASEHIPQGATGDSFPRIMDRKVEVTDASANYFGSPVENTPSQESDSLVDQSSLAFDRNKFLVDDNKSLRKGASVDPEIPVSGGRRRSFESVANKVLKANLFTKSKASALSNHVLIGFNKVANYKNQGIPPSYLENMQKVADREDTIIAVRPVEKICKTLIEEGYESKGLKIKGKSSNWGPMAGFIPVDQGFSKLAGDPEKIAKSNAVNQKAIHVDHHANEEHLHISRARIDELTDMGILKNPKPVEAASGYKEALVFESKPQHGKAQLFEAHQRNDGQWDVFSGSGDAREKMMVIPKTADFDLLFCFSPYESVDLGAEDKKQAFDAKLGILSKRSEKIKDALNDAFNRGEGKDMVHHGADTDNPVTDMKANLPATVVIPESMLKKMSIYTESPILVMDKAELVKLFRAMRDNGIRVETNPLWNDIKHAVMENFNKKVDFFESQASQNKG